MPTAAPSDLARSPFPVRLVAESRNPLSKLAENLALPDGRRLEPRSQTAQVEEQVAVGAKDARGRCIESSPSMEVSTSEESCAGPAHTIFDSQAR